MNISCIMVLLILYSCAQRDLKEKPISFPEEVSLDVLSTHETFELRDDLRMSQIGDFLILKSFGESKSILTIYDKRDFSYKQTFYQNRQ